MRYSAIVLLALLAAVLNAPARATTPSATFDVGGTHVIRYGSGEPAMILVPGLTDSAAVWDGTVAHFAPTHTVYTVTLAGFGGTKPAASAPIDAAVRDLTALIAREHVKPVIVGHSLGGFVTIRMAEEHGDLMRGAVAVDGMPVFPGLDLMTPAQRAAAAAQTAAPFQHMTADQLYAGSRIYSVPYLTQPQNVETVASFGKGADPLATAQYLTDMVSSDLRPNLSKVTIPLLELAPFDATLDPVNPQTPTKTLADKQAYYAKLLAADPTAKVRMIDHSRHFIMVDQPQAFYEAVDDFLASLK